MTTDTKPEKPERKPLYWRVLRLRHVHPSNWQRAAFFEGSIVTAAVLVLADLASAWLLLVLPVAVAGVVKAHDVLVGWLAEVPPITEASDEQTVDAPAVSDAEPERAPEPAPEPEPELDAEPNVRVVPPPKPRPARTRPGAAAARAQAATGVRRTETTPREAKSSG